MRQRDLRDGQSRTERLGVSNSGRHWILHSSAHQEKYQTARQDAGVLRISAWREGTFFKIVLVAAALA